jgi:hypothetical protein
MNTSIILFLSRKAHQHQTPNSTSFSLYLTNKPLSLPPIIFQRFSLLKKYMTKNIKKKKKTLRTKTSKPTPHEQLKKKKKRLFGYKNGQSGGISVSNLVFLISICFKL